MTPPFACPRAGTHLPGRRAADRRRRALWAGPSSPRWRAGGLGVLLLVLLAGCAVVPFRREPSRPGRTTLASPLVILPARRIGNFLLLETTGSRNGPSHFLVDTGSSVTLVAPTLLRHPPERKPPVPGIPRVRVAGADGAIVELPAASLRELTLGDARFENVPVLVYDCAPLSAHLGVKIDGVLGFPLFREILLTLDYPGNRVVLQPAATLAIPPGMAIPLDDNHKTPVIRMQLGERSLVALVDSGSDAAFSLNPVGLDPRFAFGPRIGGTIGTIGGEHRQRLARLEDPISIGDLEFPRPIVDLTDNLSAIGAGLLRHFSVTFDQEHNRVVFHRNTGFPIRFPPLRSAGLSFNKTPAYWKVASVVPDSPAATAGLRAGDLITRIDGEPVAQWDLERYDRRVAAAEKIDFTFLRGASVSASQSVQVFELVP